MKWNKKAIMELIGYGIASGLFAVAYFFGLLYPEYGMAKGTYRVIDETIPVQEAIDLDDLDPAELKRIPREKVVYRSYLWDCLETSIFDRS